MSTATEQGRRLAAQQDKPHIHVACGVLRAADGRVLIVQRPPGKIAAGKWEFPGGKIEQEESPQSALYRELEEEIGIHVRAARPLLHFVQDYRERVVTLETWLVEAWDGVVQACEGQALAWRAIDDTADLDVLPTVAPILRALALPEQYVFTPPDAGLDFILAGLSALPHGALLRLRRPDLDDVAYAALAACLIGPAHARGLRLVLDRDAAMAARLGAAGLHLRHAQLRDAGARTAAEGLLRIASCHDAASIESARAQGVDAIVLGPVLPTATHPGAPTLGWTRFAELAAHAGRPVYAIGGMAPHELARAYAHRAQGLAGISAYWSRSASGAAGASSSDSTAGIA